MSHSLLAKSTMRKLDNYLYKLSQVTALANEPMVTTEKQADGSYWIRAVSTAAIPDREDETFTIAAIDYDIQEAKSTGTYPEFRLFHKEGLAIGKVEKMSRVGIFAIDEGPSYTDPFSLEACEKMLINNKDGKWRVSRGFYVYEASGNCVICNKELIVTAKHILTGFMCPGCKSVHLGNKRDSLVHLKFLKARSYDITITEIPCVPWTGVTATKMEDTLYPEDDMNKSALRKRLLDAGFDESIVDEKLKSLTDEQLKEFKDIPTAVAVLKEELQAGEGDVEAAVEEFELDPVILKEFGEIVDAKFEKAMQNLEIDLGDLEVELKDIPELVSMKEDIDTLKESIEEIHDMLSELLDSKKEAAVAATPASNGRSRLKVRRVKAVPPPPEEDDDEEDEEDDVPVQEKQVPTAMIADATGTTFGSMTEFILGR